LEKKKFYSSLLRTVESIAESCKNLCAFSYGQDEFQNEDLCCELNFIPNSDQIICALKQFPSESSLKWNGKDNAFLLLKKSDSTRKLDSLGIITSKDINDKVVNENKNCKAKEIYDYRFTDKCIT
jgi:hypothetical protein